MAGLPGAGKRRGVFHSTKTRDRKLSSPKRYREIGAPSRKPKTKSPELVLEKRMRVRAAVE